MKRPIAAMARGVVLAAALFAVPAALPTIAQAGVPSQSERADAKRFARNYWEDRYAFAPCYRVRTRVVHADPNTFGYVRPAAPCTIYLNRDVDWTDGGRRDTWWAVCATVIHEYGHVVGRRRHSGNPESIMASSVEENHRASWWPWFPGCRYDGDDADGDGAPDW